jgi:hypothetical protein
MDLFYLGLATACGFAVWGLAVLCQRLQPASGGRS